VTRRHARPSPRNVLNFPPLTGHLVEQVVGLGPAVLVDQLTQQRHEVGAGTVSIDLGPSFVAVVEWPNPGRDPLAPDAPITGAGIRQLAEGAYDYSRKIRRLQRKLDRQHRAGSPDCFRSDGTHNAECRWRDQSKNARQTQSTIAEIHRRLAAYRKTAHGAMITEWLSVGPHRVIVYLASAEGGFFWQAVALSVTAEAFLFTIALGHTTSDAGRYIAASLTSFVASASLVLMRSQRRYQTIEGVWMDVIEERQEQMSLRGQRDPTRGVG